ncbi:MAG TPA: hypothetical protein VNU70_08965, partial [Puia sp.]|nr:hypothetical protein [Puia sp.]
MKKMTLIAFALTAITFLMSVPAMAQQKDKTRDDDDFSWNGWGDNPGVWSAYINNDKVHMQFGGHHWNSSGSFLLSELGTLPTGQAGTFTVKREAGTITFNGKFAEKEGHGTYVFVEDPAFKSYLEQEGFKEVSEELMIHLFFTNIN